MEKPILLQQQQQPTQLQPTTILPAIPQQPTHTPKHVLFDLTPLDVGTEDIEERTRRSYSTVKQMITGKSAKECQEIYQKHIAANPQQHTEELTMGLLVAILVEQNGQNDYYRDVVTFSRDNLALFSNYLNMIIIERITRVSQHSIKQIFWLASQLIKGGTSSAETTCSNLIRQTAKGDVSPRNLFMVENLLDLLTDNRTWLINSNSFMGPTVIYNVTRLVLDHLPTAYHAIRQREIEFVIALIREKFEFVLSIGKDFLRLLNSLQKVGGFHQLFQDVYINDPKSLHPNYEGPKQLLAQRTPRRLFQSCLTFDMERKISYLATQVRFGNQKRYQDWFHRQYLSGPEGHITPLRCDLIRYICTIIHPSNEVLCSDIIPRWAIIGWLLTTISHVVMQCRQALFFDWCAFDPKIDNIMNIEPAILVMYYSARSHPQVTTLLLDYLCRAPSMFSFKLQDTVRVSIKKSLQQILEKRVLQSLAPLFINQKYDSGLKTRLKECFPEYCQTDNGSVQPNNGPSPIVPAQTPTNQTTSVGQVDSKPPDSNKQQQGDVITLDDDPSSEHVQATLTDTSKTIQEGTANVPSIGFQPSMKINMPATYSTTKVTPTTNTTTTTKPSTNSNRNGIDPIEALINVGPTAVGNKTNTNTPAANIKRISSPTVINQEDAVTSKRATDSPSVCNSSRFSYGNETCGLINDDTNDVHLDVVETSNATQIELLEQKSNIKVIYPFMTVNRVLPDDVLESFGNKMNLHLSHLHKDVDPNLRVTHASAIMDTLINDDQSTYSDFIDNLGCHIANMIAEDFEERIHPSLRDKIAHQKKNITPLFVLASYFHEPKCLTLLAAIARYFEATSFLLLYYLRLHQLYIDPKTKGKSLVDVYHSFSTNRYDQAFERDELTECLISDLKEMLTYDSEMFCFMLPCVFSEFALSEKYFITNNCELIRMVTAAVDPISLQELMCQCLTGSSKIISREEPMSVIETSLSWESWEQYCFWKILTAQSVPIENYLSILTKLNAQSHPEIMTSIMLNLQKVSEPDINILRTIVDTYNKQNEQFVSAIIRYWSIRSDLKEMSKNLVSLIDSKPPSPDVKRKGQTKKTTVAKSGPGSTSSFSSTTLSARSEKLLLILDLIRRRAPRNKLLAQVDILDALALLEPMCNENQRPKLKLLLQSRTKPTKKKKTDKD